MSTQRRLTALLPVGRGPRRLALLLASLAALALLTISESAYRLATEATDTLRARQTTRFEVATLLRHLDASESAQRGFLIVGRDQYLKPFTERRAEVAALLATLRNTYADSAWRTQVDLLARSVDEKYAELDETLRLHRDGSNDAWRSLMETDIGRERMEAVRSASERLIAYESERIAAERDAIGHALTLGRYGVHALTLLSVIGLVVFLRRNADFVAAQKAHASALAHERDRLDSEVIERTAQLTELARHLQTVREDERAHLARELHDELGALLTSAKLDLARLQRSLKAPEVDRIELVERLRHMSATIDEGIQLKRRIIEDLRPSALSNLGLVTALEILTREFALRTGIAVHTELDDTRIDGERALALYRFVQEAMTNTAKHALARELWVRLEALPDGGCRAEVRDDGQGFDTRRLLRGGHGLVGMRYRVEALGGTLQVEGRPGRGARLEVALPPAADPATPAEAGPLAAD